MERDGSSSNNQNFINKNIPISSISTLMRPIPPRLAKITGESKEYIRSCTVEFIKLVTNEANEHCNRAQRKTISPEDIISALSSLGFHNYVNLVSPESRDNQIPNNVAVEEHMVGGEPPLPPPHEVVPEQQALPPYGGNEADGGGNEEEVPFDPLMFLNDDNFFEVTDEETGSKIVD